MIPNSSRLSLKTSQKICTRCGKSQSKLDFERSYDRERTPIGTRSSRKLVSSATSGDDRAGAAINQGHRLQCQGLACIISQRIARRAIFTGDCNPIRDHRRRAFLGCLRGFFGLCAHEENTTAFGRELLTPALPGIVFLGVHLSMAPLRRDRTPPAPVRQMDPAGRQPSPPRDRTAAGWAHRFALEARWQLDGRGAAGGAGFLGPVRAISKLIPLLAQS